MKLHQKKRIILVNNGDEAFPYEGGMSLKELIVEIALLVRKRSTLQDEQKYDGEM